MDSYTLWSGMMRRPWLQVVRNSLDSVGYGVRAASLWVELCVLDAAPHLPRARRRLLVVVSLLAAPVVTPALLVLDAVTEALRRRMVMWW